MTEYPWLERGLIIAPSILSAEFCTLADEVKRAEEGGADWLHIDVMDGHFVPNITIGPCVIESLKKYTGLVLDVHLMIREPEKYLQQFADAGSDYITVHVEADIDLKTAVDKIHSLGKKAGVSVNPDTPLTEVKPVMHDIDLLLIMSVNPGFGGQGYIDVSEKISHARKVIEEKGLNCILMVDGGIKDKNAGEVVRAGANALVAGSFVFKGPGTVKENIQALRDAA